MWLLNVETRELEEYFGTNTPPYAILSHTWQQGEEVTFVDLTLPDKARHKAGWKKIIYTCQQAKQEEIEFVWVDTCCIDKRSSAELSEAINSMFAWYSNAKVCYVYMIDVSVRSIDATFPSSRWFTRGWTLQELLAPQEVLFFDKDWKSIGSKAKDLCASIAAVTKIDIDVLKDPNVIKDQSVACRMSWASSRTTTRLEDVSYSLMGIFGVNMPLLYGEGERAFGRLQDEILKAEFDQSIFAWGLKPYRLNSSGELIPLERSAAEGSLNENDSKSWSENSTALLAESPVAFGNSGNIVKGDSYQLGPSIMTNKGLQLTIPIVTVFARKFPLGLLDCHVKGSKDYLVAVYLVERVAEGQFNRQKVPGGWSSKVVPFGDVMHAKLTNAILRRHPYDHRLQGPPDELYSNHMILDRSHLVRSLFRPFNPVLPPERWNRDLESFRSPPEKCRSYGPYCMVFKLGDIEGCDKDIIVFIESTNEFSVKISCAAVGKSTSNVTPDRWDGSGSDWSQWAHSQNMIFKHKFLHEYYSKSTGSIYLSALPNKQHLEATLKTREICGNKCRVLKLDLVG